MSCCIMLERTNPSWRKRRSHVLVFRPPADFWPGLHLLLSRHQLLVLLHHQPSQQVHLCLVLMLGNLLLLLPARVPICLLRALVMWCAILVEVEGTTRRI